jgi:hypothetical protein
MLFRYLTGEAEEHFKQDSRSNRATSRPVTEERYRPRQPADWLKGRAPLEKHLHWPVLDPQKIILKSLLTKLKLKLHGLSPRENYTDRATAACRRS